MPKKIRPDDTGPAKFHVSTDPVNKIIMLIFDKPVAWVALTPEIAKKLGGDLLEDAENLSVRAAEGRARA
jgi:hypothetical protein